MGCASSRQISRAPQTTAKHKNHRHPQVPRDPDVSAPPAVHSFHPSPDYSQPEYRLDVSEKFGASGPMGFRTRYDSCTLPPSDFTVSKNLTCARKNASANSGIFIPGHKPHPTTFAKSSKQVRVVGRTARDGPTAPKPRRITIYHT